MSSIGSRFALYGEAPTEWNGPGLLPDTQVAFRSQAGEGFVLEVFAKGFRERLLRGAQVWVYTAHIVREDAEILFAFETVAERALFLEFRDIDSIGPKTAAQILGGLDRAHLSDLVNGRGLTGLRISGVGPKTLDKLALGVKSKREKFLRLLAVGGAVKGTEPNGTERIEDVPFALIQGLEKLGLKRDDVIRVYRELPDDVATMPPADVIRLVLQRWGQLKAKIQVANVEGNS